ncbi:Uncharacterized protein BM_BM7783 [Brugia malayi]|uniref:Uncharacterized protein n=1 Tax=Brugia malayi TaxID=6279 RepID=A0A4E9FD32_BRUMA|nr:Uncharacterized protein BM_BM7783 [Brugia malayi]VIO91490.1 Uncharacterized protein BM_BM7783 [Brugia malayi]
MTFSLITNYWTGKILSWFSTMYIVLSFLQQSSDQKGHFKHGGVQYCVSTAMHVPTGCISLLLSYITCFFGSDMLPTNDINLLAKMRLKKTGKEMNDNISALFGL